MANAVKKWRISIQKGPQVLSNTGHSDPVAFIEDLETGQVLGWIGQLDITRILTQMLYVATGQPTRAEILVSMPGPLTIVSAAEAEAQEANAYTERPQLGPSTTIDFSSPDFNAAVDKIGALFKLADMPVSVETFVAAMAWGVAMLKNNEADFESVERIFRAAWRLAHEGEPYAHAAKPETIQ